MSEIKIYCVREKYDDDIEFDVDYEYVKGQKEIRYPNCKAQEGIPDHIEINSVQYKSREVYGMLKQDTLEAIEEKVWDEIEMEMWPDDPPEPEPWER